MGGLTASFLGLSGPLRAIVYAGIAAAALGIAVTWLRHDAAMDERRGAAARSNAEVIEALKERNKIEREVGDAGHDDLRDLLGIPH